MGRKKKRKSSKKMGNIDSKLSAVPSLFSVDPDQSVSGGKSSNRSGSEMEESRQNHATVNSQTLKCSDCLDLVPWLDTKLPNYMICMFMETKRKYMCEQCAADLMDPDLLCEIECARKEDGSIFSTSTIDNKDSQRQTPTKTTSSQTEQISDFTLNRQQEKQECLMKQMADSILDLQSSLSKRFDDLHTVIESRNRTGLEPAINQDNTDNDNALHHRKPDTAFKSHSYNSLQSLGTSINKPMFSEIVKNKTDRALQGMSYVPNDAKSDDVKKSDDKKASQNKNLSPPHKGDVSKDKHKEQSSFDTNNVKVHEQKKEQSKQTFKPISHKNEPSGSSKSDLPSVLVCHDSVFNGISGNRLGEAYGLSVQKKKTSTIEDCKKALLTDNVQSTDVIALHIGVNDLKKSQDPQDTANTYIKLVKDVQDKHPNIHIVVSRIAPTHVQELNIKREIFNAEILSSLSSLKNVSIVSHENIGNNTLYLWDRIHPSQRGLSVFAGNLGRHLHYLLWSKPNRSRRRFTQRPPWQSRYQQQHRRGRDQPDRDNRFS